MMPDISDNRERRGSVFLAMALLVVGFLFIKSPLEETLKAGKVAMDSLVGTACVLFVLWRAFRGERISLKLAKGVAILFALLTIVLAVVAAVTLSMGKPLPVAPSVGNSLPFLASAAGVAFATWSLFFSEDVKAFVAARQSETERRKLKLPAKV